VWTVRVLIVVFARELILCLKGKVLLGKLYEVVV
jgi:hypothetical protein